MKINYNFRYGKILILAIALFFTQKSYGISDVSKICLSAYVPDQIEQMPDAARNLLENKLNQIVTNNGMGGGINSRFIITANIVVMTKDITATAPPMQAFTLEITLFIGDAIDGIKFSSHSVTLKGVGENETKAYISALKNLNTNDPQYQSFINEGKNKIIDYYKNKCDYIINESKGLLSQNQFDAAISKLVDVPDVCKECHDKCISMAVEIYNGKMNRECSEAIQKSKTLLSQENYNAAADNLSKILPDLPCYTEVKALLTEISNRKCSVALGKAKGAWAAKDIDATSNALKDIPYNSSCHGDAIKLIDEVNLWVKEKDKKEWDFKVQEQKDNEEFAKQQQKDNAEFAKQQHKEDTEISKMTIQAAREVGVAYATNQPRVVYNVRGWW